MDTVSYQSPLVAVNVPIRGRYLAHNRLTPVKRAFIAADLKLGTRQLVELTTTQAARLARTNTAYVWHALQRMNERAAIEAEITPLVPPHPSPSIVSDNEVADFVRRVGVDRLLNAACQIEVAQQ
jgi:hypothetical protein